MPRAKPANRSNAVRRPCYVPGDAPLSSAFRTIPPFTRTTIIMIPVQFIFLFLLSTFANSATVTPPSLHFPLTRRSAGKPLDLQKAADHLRAKYGYPTHASKLGKRQHQAGIPIVNQVRHLPAVPQFLTHISSLGRGFELLCEFDHWNTVCILFL